MDRQSADRQSADRPDEDWQSEDWQSEDWQRANWQRANRQHADRQRTGWQRTDWQLRAIRGATTVSENSAEAIAEAVNEMLDDVEARNQLDPTQILSVTFSVTKDLDAIFPAAIARRRPQWDCVPLLDVQQMHVEGALTHCIRLMMYVPLRVKQSDVSHAYMRGAKSLRPDLCLTPD